MEQDGGDKAVLEAAAGDVHLPTPWTPQAMCTGWGFVGARVRQLFLGPKIIPAHWDSWILGICRQQPHVNEPCIQGLTTLPIPFDLRSPPSLSTTFCFVLFCLPLKFGTFPNSIGDSERVGWRDRQAELVEDKEHFMGVPSAAGTQSTGRSRQTSVGESEREGVAGCKGLAETQSEQELAVGQAVTERG